ncbi:MAG TPA: 4Fe-4S dicluster domain-containing protein [Thermoanaerobaculaceae bacterium]|nr:4Fe-4S dicluster domain-containing protein [Thermoanaerobaculaceae bacterium]
MKELQVLARKLLAEGSVGVVIGYEEGPHGVRPAFITRSEDAGRLVFDPRCVHNLATYLSPRRSVVKGLGKPAVVVKGCDARAVAGLLRESQLTRDDVVLIAVRCGGVMQHPAQHVDLRAETVADRCAGCDVREPHLFDFMVGEAPTAPPATDRREARIRELEAGSPADRWAFWQQELARCVRCHACRQACPMCFCERCVADKTQPGWIESSPHPRGNLAFHLTRAIHQAGRCVDCGECERACPAGIPLGLLNRKLALVVAERFGHHASDDPSVPAPIGSYASNDGQEFIL